MNDYISKSKLKEMLVYCRGLGRKSLEAVVKTINEQPTLDEKEIIRKTVERVLERLEECEERYEDVAFMEMNENGHTLDFEYAKGKKYGVEETIQIIKEECGINE